MSERHYKRGKRCPYCGIDFWLKTYGVPTGGTEWTDVWECPNCDHRDARRRNKRATEESKMTPSQRKAIDRAMEYVKRNDLHEGYELIDYEEKMTVGGRVQVSFKIRLATPGTIGYAFPGFYLLYVGRAGGYEARRYAKNDKGEYKDETYTGRLALIYCRQP